MCVDIYFTEVILIFRNENAGRPISGNTDMQSRVSTCFLYFHGHMKEMLLCCLIFINAQQMKNSYQKTNLPFEDLPFSNSQMFRKLYLVLAKGVANLVYINVECFHCFRRQKSLLRVTSLIGNYSKCLSFTGNFF